MTSSEASSSEAEQCAEDIEVERITSKNGNIENIEAKSEEVNHVPNAVRFSKTIKFYYIDRWWCF